MPTAQEHKGVLYNSEGLAGKKQRWDREVGTIKYDLNTLKTTPQGL